MGSGVSGMIGRLILASRTTLLVAVPAVVLSLVIGSLWGVWAGYYRGWRETVSMRIADVITKSAVNGWAALGDAIKPVDDPRHNTFDWESWHECDVFRAEVENRLKR